MNLTRRIYVIFAFLLVVTVGAVFAYESYYVWPRKNCEKTPGHWWAEKYHQCATVVSVQRFVGRLGPAGKPTMTNAPKAASSK
ncbi:MAG: hypothetical protein JSR45_08560 [Proteobacteria bacterium]|nr:hypothetical protein [Pseudomonadota bacterium]